MWLHTQAAIMEKPGGNGVSVCKTCSQTLPVGAFESTPSGVPRKECKECRKKRRCAAVAAARQGAEAAAEEAPTRGPPAPCKRAVAADADGFRKRNAATHLAWAHRNPEAVREQQRKMATEPSRRFKQLVTSAKSRGIDVAEAGAEAMRAKMMRACHYCAFMPQPGEPLNGLDRVDPEGGYTEANTVPCCSTCNAMKGSSKVDEFLGYVRRIVHHLGIEPRGEQSSSSRVRLPAFCGRAELRAAPDKEKRDELSDDRRVALWSSPCYLCGRTPAFGIDREDSAGDYTPENSRPCCTECNYMKKDLQLDAFRTHVAHVHSHTAAWVLKDAADATLRTCGGIPREPVGAHDASGNLIIVFPSMTTAARMIACSSQAILKAVDKRGTCRGCSWARMTPRAYRGQMCSADQVFAAISAMRRV